MNDFERALRETDFSKYTDLKARLATRLFSAKTESKASITAFPFSRVSDAEAEMVKAAQGVVYKDPSRKDET